ncbi:MAG: hypothetical protein U9R23_04625 [Candidatus Cloacimonadota bacterium]|nr:hypothetical protein [Candidatus Cloacimonadota bacterium]
MKGKITVENEIEIYEQGLEEYLKINAVISNFFMVLWIVLGTIGCWFLFPLAAWLYLAFAIIMIGIVLRKLLCTNCYYYNKWCCMGWGKLSALFFKRGNIEKFNTGIGQKLAPLTYGILTLLPLILIVISLIQKFTVSKIAVLLLLLLVSFYSGTISRKKTCAKCKMRLMCAGSAIKN